MSWKEERAKFQSQFDDLAQENIQGLITDLNTAVGNYVSKGGISQDPLNSPDYATIIKLTTKASDIKQKYATLNDNITKYLASKSSSNNLSGILKENGELQRQINRLEKIVSDMKVDVDSAVARDELLRSRNTEINKHQLFLLDRPVRKGLIPYLWVLSVLFIGIGLIVFRMTFPSLSFISSAATTNTSVSILTTLIDFLTNKVVLLSLLGSTLIVIVFLSLKIAGVFGR